MPETDGVVGSCGGTWRIAGIELGFVIKLLCAQSWIMQLCMNPLTGEDVIGGL